MEKYIIIEPRKRRMQCKNLAEVEKKGNYHNFEENCTDLFCKAKKEKEKKRHKMAFTTMIASSESSNFW